MKKIGLFVILLLMPISVYATSFKLRGTDMNISFDESNWYVFTPDNILNNEELEELGISYEYMVDSFNNNEAYLDAILFFLDSDDYIEVFVRKTKVDDINNFSNYSKEAIEVFGQAFIEEHNIDKYEVYQNDYLNTMFKEDDITKFKENSLIDDVSFKLDFSQGVFKGNQNFEIYQIKNTKNFDYQSGHYPSKENQIIINQKAAKKYDLKVNDEIEYELNGISYSFSISAIINDYVNEGSNIYIDRNIIDENLRQQLETKDVLILVSSKYKQVLDKYQDDFLLVSYHQEYVDSYQMLFDLAYIVVIIFISVSFFISIILISIILKTIFIERKKDTCILQVNGISKLRIVSLFGFEAMLIGMIIGIVGSVVAFGTLFLISLFDLDKNIIGINNLFVLPRYFLGSFDLFILLIFIYIIICWISGVHGALIINKMDGSILLKEN